MSFRELRQRLITRLDEGGGGARGWFLITRVHLNLVRLQQTASYLYDAGGTEELELTPKLYRDLAAMLGIETDNPAQVINRHLFLAMETPLRLLRKIDPNRWTSVVLTEAGVRLATESNAVAIFEAILLELGFCREPWYTVTRVAEYAEFDVRPYPTILDVMRHNGGHVDLDEFGTSSSRAFATKMKFALQAMLSLSFEPSPSRKSSKCATKSSHGFPPGSGRDPRKPYSNWRDMARHTFSLFSLGQSAYRAGNELFLARMLTQGTASMPRSRTERAPGMSRADANAISASDTTLTDHTFEFPTPTLQTVSGTLLRSHRATPVRNPKF